MEELKVQPLSSGKSPVKSPKRPPPPPLAARVRVAVRVRPPVTNDGDEPHLLCVTEADLQAGAGVGDTHTTLQFQLEKMQKTFRFDHVFSAESQQSDVYNASLQPLLASLLHGFNVTVLAYGQTGSGKTYTMGGTQSLAFESGSDDGLIPRFLRDLFEALGNEATVKTTANVSFLEIYCDEIRDLLVDGENAQNGVRPHSATRLTIHEDDQEVWVEGLQKPKVKNIGETLKLLKAGRQRQTIGAHALNDHSSRSHAVYTLEVSRVFANEIKGAKLTFVDLAGSERVKKTLMEGQGMKEGSHINIGLLALGNVINALGSRQRVLQRRNSTGVSGRKSSISRTDSITNPLASAHVPYRSSKLTRLLRDALGGNSVTLFIACISPEAANGNETLCTLQYANRARTIQNKAQKNVEEADSRDTMDDPAAIQQATETEREVNDLRDQVTALKLQLGQAVAAAKAAEARGVSKQNEVVSSWSNQANELASKPRRSPKTRRSLRIAPLDLSKLVTSSDIHDHLESHQQERVTNKNIRQLQKDNFFTSSTAKIIADNLALAEDEPQPPVEIHALCAPQNLDAAQSNQKINVCSNVIQTKTASPKLTHSPVTKVVNTTRPGNHSPQTTLTSKIVRGKTSQGTQYELPLRLHDERKTPVDYVLLSPSQIFREVHHQKQKALIGAPSPWPHHRRLATPHKVSGFSVLKHDTQNTYLPSQKNVKCTETPVVLQELLQRMRQLIEDGPDLGDLDTTPESDECQQNQKPLSPLSLDAFVDRMTALYDQRRRQHQFVNRLRQRLRHLAAILCSENFDSQMNELSKYTLEHQQFALHQQLETCERLAAERLWVRLQHREAAIENYGGVWNEKLEEVFVTDDQYEACTPWYSHRDDHKFFQRRILPFVLNGWISVAPEDLDNEEVWLTL